MRAPIGILILDTRFPRLPGDIGNPDSFAFPVLYEKLHGIGPQQAVRDAPTTPDLIDMLVRAAEALIARGAQAITTSCGFLALFQPDLAARLRVPVATSALLMVPWLGAVLPAGKRIGILTAEAASLTPAHLAAVGVPVDTPVEGLPKGGAFSRCFLDNSAAIDRAAVAAEVVAAGRRLQARHPEIGGIVLECTNLPPYAAALSAALGLPVWSVLDLLQWLQAGLSPRGFGE